MDEQKKQKVLLAVLAVLVLGAGSYFFLGRESSGPAKEVLKKGTGERKKRAQPAKPQETRKRRTRTRRHAEPTVKPGRKVREVRTTQPKGRKTRRGKERKVKKKKLAPAA